MINEFTKSRPIDLESWISTLERQVSELRRTAESPLETEAETLIRLLDREDLVKEEKVKFEIRRVFRNMYSQ